MHLNFVGAFGLAGQPGSKGFPGEVIMPEIDLILGRPGFKGDRGFPGLDGTRGQPGKLILKICLVSINVILKVKYNVIFTGPPGRPGDSGPTGAQGEKGAAGEFGSPGFDAQPGNPGYNGQKGEPADFIFNREILRGESGYDGTRLSLYAFNILLCAIATVL